MLFGVIVLDDKESTVHVGGSVIASEQVPNHLLTIGDGASKIGTYLHAYIPVRSGSLVDFRT